MQTKPGNVRKPETVEAKQQVSADYPDRILMKKRDIY